jgi:hypothetical protein
MAGANLINVTANTIIHTGRTTLFSAATGATAVDWLDAGSVLRELTRSGPTSGRWRARQDSTPNAAKSW